MTAIIDPSFGSVDLWRDVIKNNRALRCAVFTIESDETWLPRILVDAGFFPSGGEVKRNRPDLWRDSRPFDGCELSWADIEIVPMGWRWTE